MATRQRCIQGVRGQGSHGHARNFLPCEKLNALTSFIYTVTLLPRPSDHLHCPYHVYADHVTFGNFHVVLSPSLSPRTRGPQPGYRGQLTLLNSLRYKSRTGKSQRVYFLPVYFCTATGGLQSALPTHSDGSLPLAGSLPPRSLKRQHIHTHTHIATFRHTIPPLSVTSRHILHLTFNRNLINNTFHQK